MTTEFASPKKKQRVDWLKGQRTSYEGPIQEISDLFTPYRGDITSKTKPGDRRKPLWDPVGVLAADRLVNFLLATLFSSSHDWLGLRARGVDEFDQEVERVLDVTARRMLEALADSNFYVSAHPWVQDWSVLGNGTLYCQHDDERAPAKTRFGGLIFDPIPWSRAWWIFSHIGRPLMLVRDVAMPAIDAVNFFSGSADNPGEKLRTLAEDKPFEEVVCSHLVERDHAGKSGTTKKPWKSTWLVGEEGHVAREAGFDENPYIAARHMILDGEQYGRGRGHIARPFAKGVNVLTHQKFLALGKEVNPNFLAEDDALIQYDFSPGGHIIVRPPKEMAPQYLRSGTDFNMVETITENLHRHIREAFLGDVLSEPETQTRSAEAERSRLNRALTRVSSVNHTVVHEMLYPLTETVMDIMLKRDGLPELKALVNERDGKMEVIPVFSSPFFTAQKAMSKLRVDAFVDSRLQRWERTSDLAWLEDLDQDAIREYERKMADVPADIFKRQEEIDQLRDARGDQAAEDRALDVLLGRGGRAQTQVQLRPGGSRPAPSPNVAQGVAV